MYPKIWELIKQVVRKHQPQKDVDTVKSMIDKYGDNGGRIHEDSCFYFTNPSIEKDNDSGREYERDNEVHVDMTLDAISLIKKWNPAQVFKTCPTVEEGLRP